MLEIFIVIDAVIALSLIGYISILHNNHRSEIEELERELAAKDRVIDKYRIKELKNELKKNNKDVSKSQYEILSWEESTTNWVKRHEHIYDVLGVNYKGLNEADPYVVIEYKLKK
ncbi:hypothetical protein P3U41_06205 [Mammaliicoccus sciuri]|uniref:hypothetical protein n=1 Tax=Mammaliicoccus sciuri TaxID=1296 RepID=UPI002B262321|nr:hypothetical protein [Mammaliicoccus sciuri]WQL34364.1 hypothetical protein P3U41_06205 [Mammaliicoccus sciuri]WQL61303.1 hypothetical protein P3T96_06205 [Mammaliicoccus sciuri]